ncbi:hypothetical protein HDU98_008443 [Podochytrium sp. JEL0797]|nr:hypothetical protein HDU98_008443 [Podochytrium sp. JEL0797]
MLPRITRVSRTYGIRCCSFSTKAADSMSDCVQVITGTSGDFTSRLVSKVSFKPGQIVASMASATPTNLKKYSSVQTGPDSHVELNSDLLYMNHSCDPNVVLDVEHNVVAAAREISPGEGITFFYPSTEWEMDQSFPCWCGSPKCLKHIKGAKFVDGKTLEQFAISKHIKKMVQERDSKVLSERNQKKKMNATHKTLISHCQSLLSKHHALARGTYKSGAAAVHESGLHGLQDADAFDSDGDGRAADFSEPVIIVDEKAMLQEYWKEHEITDPSDRIFLEEALLGCVRHEKVIDITLKLFYKSTGGRYLKSEYNLFAVLVFLCLYRLPADLPFATLAKFFKAYNPTKMALFLAFLFDSAHLVDDGILAKAWGTILDRDHIKSKMLHPLLQHAHPAKSIIEHLIHKSEKGMVPTKSTKPATEPAPFILTVAHPRKVPEPPYTHSTVTKARAVPASVYTGTGEVVAIEKAKEENRRRVKERNEGYEREQFSIARRAGEKQRKGREVAADAVGLSEVVVGKVKVKAKPVPATLYDHVPIKTTMAAILREDALVRRNKMEEEKSASEVEFTLRDVSEFQSWQEEVKLKAEEARVLELQKLRLKVHLAHEDSFLSRQDKLLSNKELVQEVKVEKEALKQITKQAKKELDEENRRKIDDVHESMEGVVKAKEKVVVEKQRKAADFSTENQLLLEQAHRLAEQELARKIELIQQIRLLEKSIPPVGALVKSLDLTETSNLGLLGEMSIVELHERLAHIKLRESTRADEKRQEIIQHKHHRLAQVSQKLAEIELERQERRMRRVHVDSGSRSSSGACSTLVAEEEERGRAGEGGKVDPGMKVLQDKLAAKRALRVSTKMEFASQKLSGTLVSVQSQAGGLRQQQQQQQQRKISLSQSRGSSGKGVVVLQKGEVAASRRVVVKAGAPPAAEAGKGVKLASSKSMEAKVKLSQQKLSQQEEEENDLEFDERVQMLRNQLEQQRVQLLEELAQEEADSAREGVAVGLPIISIVRGASAATNGELKMVTFASH